MADPRSRASSKRRASTRLRDARIDAERKRPFVLRRRTAVRRRACARSGGVRRRSGSSFRRSRVRSRVGWRARRRLVAFPDFHLAIDDLVVDGDTVWLRMSGTGTNDGSFMGHPPTGRTMRTDVFDALRVKNGRIVERRPGPPGHALPTRPRPTAGPPHHAYLRARLTDTLTRTNTPPLVATAACVPLRTTPVRVETAVGTLEQLVQEHRFGHSPHRPGRDRRPAPQEPRAEPDTATASSEPPTRRTGKSTV